MDGVITLYTIGFAHKSAREFFELLKKHGVKRIIDVRISNTSQLAGYTKKDDLKYFLKTIADIDYVLRMDLAPSEALYRKNKAKALKKEVFEALLREEYKNHEVEKAMTREELNRACLLCSEPDVTACHRSVAANYLCEALGAIEVVDI